MKARFTIANKLILGFGILIIATVINGLLTFSTLNENQKINDELISIYNPSATYVQELYSLINGSQMLVKNWVFIEKQANTPDKMKLNDLHEFDFPELKEKTLGISNRWEPKEQAILDTIFQQISDELFVLHKTIMSNLSTFESYDDLMVVFEVNPMVEDGGVVIETTKNILAQVEALKNIINKKAENRNLEMSSSFKWFQQFVIYAILILALFALAVAFLTTRSIVTPILRLKGFLITMTRGILPKEQLVTMNDEVGDMGDALNGYIENMRKTSGFAQAIGNGAYESDFEALSQEDDLGNSLIDMRNNLKKTVLENKERIESDNIRNWVTKGLAEFGDILRQNSDNMDKLSSNIIGQLIDYLDVNQGAIYILNQQDESHSFFEMKSAIAYGREKFLKVNFDLKEGLVGRCAFEKLPVYLREVPENYIKLKSGLGSTEASNLLLVPLKVNDQVMGVVEVASFKEIPQYQIDFVTTLGENIASTISNVRINEQTKVLLEDSKLRGDELSSQEEELRQNMEELQATQEEAARRESEMGNTIAAINNTLATIDIDQHGSIISANENFINLTQLEANTLVGASFQELFAQNTNIEAEFNELWAELQAGISRIMISNFVINNKDFWFKHSFTPFKDGSGRLVKVIDLIIDITEQKEMQKELEKAKLNIG